MPSPSRLGSRNISARGLTCWQEPKRGVVAKYCAEILAEAAIVWLVLMKIFDSGIGPNFLAKFNRCHIAAYQV